MLFCKSTVMCNKRLLTYLVLT